MRLVLAIAACVLLFSGCESFQGKVDASRQDRCQRAEWTKVGERDGFDGYRNMADRYQTICGDLFNSEQYQEGLKKGLARKPTPPV